MTLVMTNLPPHWEDALSTARRMTSILREQREKEFTERKQSRDKWREERQKQTDPTTGGEVWTVRDSGEEWVAEEEKKPPRPKTKTVKTTTKDGFSKLKKIVDGKMEEEEEDEEEVVVVKAQPVDVKEEGKKPKKKKKKEDESGTILEQNPFLAALHAGSFPTIAEEQHKKNVTRGKGHLQAIITSTQKKPKKLDQSEGTEIPTTPKKISEKQPVTPAKKVEKQQPPQPSAVVQNTLKSVENKKVPVNKTEKGKPSSPTEKGKPIEKGKPTEKGKPIEKGKPAEKGKIPEKGKVTTKGKPGEKTTEKPVEKGKVGKPAEKGKIPKTPKKEKPEENSGSDDESSSSEKESPEILEEQEEIQETQKKEKPVSEKRLKQIARKKVLSKQNFWEKEWFPMVAVSGGLVLALALGYSFLLS